MKARLELEGIVKTFGPHRVLDHTCLQIKTGEVVGLIGANGAGKTTLLRIAAGLVRPDAGVVRELSGGSQPIVRYFGGEMTLPAGVRAHRWAALFGAKAHERRPLGQLSRGSRQLFGLRVALSGRDADIILLDEPWEGLDPSASAWLIEILRRWQSMGAAILVSSHRLYDLSAVCSRFEFLEDGRCRGIEPGEEQPHADRLAQAFRR
jgi:ABC-type multidrug transport system ATPase subunit